MKLRLCALLVSTLLSGCVLTDSTNMTGGDFLQAHGASVLPSDIKSFALTNTSVEVVPMEGVPGLHGSEDLVLGSLPTGDSIRLVLGFDLADTTARNKSSLAHADSLVNLRLVHPYAVASEVKVRARFVSLIDSTYLPGLLSGVEPAELEAEDPATSVFGAVSEFEFAIPASEAKDSITLVGVPLEVRNTVYDRLVKNDLLRRTNVEVPKSWLVVLLDSRAGNSRVRFSSNVTLVGTDTAVTAAKDTAGTLGLGSLYNSKTYRSVGFRPANAPVALGWWPSGGARLRVRLDAKKLRAEMHAAFGIAADTSSNGFDNTFNILQARISAPLSQVVTDGSTLRSLSISSSVLRGLENSQTFNLPRDTITYNFALSDTTLKASGLTSNPVLVLTKLPGGYQMRLLVDGTAQMLATQQSWASQGVSNMKYDSWYYRVGESIEFRPATLVRVHVSSGDAELKVSYSILERDPVADNQYGANDSLRTEAQLSPTASFVRQEVRSPFTQVVNQQSPEENRFVDIDLSPTVYCTSGCYYSANYDYSERVIAVPSDPKRVFDSVKVVVRPLIGRNN